MKLDKDVARSNPQFTTRSVARGLSEAFVLANMYASRRDREALLHYPLADYGFEAMQRANVGKGTRSAVAENIYPFVQRKRTRKHPRAILRAP